MKLTSTSIFLSAAALLFCSMTAGACVTTTSGEDGETEPSHLVQAIHLIDANVLGSLGEWDQLVIDIQSRDDIYVLDPSKGSLDLSRVRIICPNGNQMPFDAWLQEQREAAGMITSEDLRQPFAVSRSELTTNPLDGLKPTSELGGEPGYDPQAAPTECLLCVACSDGGWICFICWGD